MQYSLPEQALYDTLVTFGSNLKPLINNYNFLLAKPVMTELEQQTFKDFLVQMVMVIQHIKDSPTVLTYQPLAKCLTVLQVFEDFIQESKPIDDDTAHKMDTIFYQALVEWTAEFN